MTEFKQNFKNEENDDNEVNNSKTLKSQHDKLFTTLDKDQLLLEYFSFIC